MLLQSYISLFVLLKPTGSGKTTTIDCLTGALTPTDGCAKIFGLDTRTHMHQIRRDIGFCPQHNCLFPLLTVREHIQLFSRIKGLYAKVSKDETEEQVSKIIQEVALSEKSNTMAKHLSGGMKRKVSLVKYDVTRKDSFMLKLLDSYLRLTSLHQLSVAIAFCGGSKVCILDEATSGM